jgi:hypothetical protein
MAKDGSISLKEAIRTRHFIFGAELISRTEIKKEVYYTVLVKDIIKGNLAADTVKLKFMYESEGRTYVHKNLKFVVCIVDYNSTGDYYEDLYFDNMRSFKSIDDYNSSINYFREAYFWISTKDPFKRKTLKSNWISRYITNSDFKYEIYYEIILHRKEYGTVNTKAQRIIRDEIIRQFDEEYSIAGAINVLTGKFKKEVINYMLDKLDVNDLKKTCSIMDTLWYILEEKGIKLHTLWSDCCDGPAKSINEYEKLINKFKVAAR